MNIEEVIAEGEAAARSWIAEKGIDRERATVGSNAYDVDRHNGRFAWNLYVVIVHQWEFGVITQDNDRTYTVQINQGQPTTLGSPPGAALSQFVTKTLDDFWQKLRPREIEILQSPKTID